ncbi:MAG: ROK family protein [Candidatus Excrementavichristensenella sp.]|jgi:predicted NBD/HSP70 family sugar kinase
MFYLNPANDTVERLKPQQALRSANLKLLFDLILSRQAENRAELARASGLSPAAVSALIDELIFAGLIREAGTSTVHTGGGRRPINLVMDPTGAHFPVFSIGDCGISYTLLDLNGQILETIFRPCLQSGDNGILYGQIIEDVLHRQSEYIDLAKSPAILISLPGVYLEEEKLFLLTGFDMTFSAEGFFGLEERMGIPVFVGNASNALGYAQLQHYHNLGIPVDELIYLNICAGVGSGVLFANQPAPHRGRLSGEIGHMIISMNGRPCPCGQKGCLEQYVSIDAILAEVRDAISQDTSGLYENKLRDLLSETTLERIGQADAEGVAPVAQALDRIAQRLFAGIYGMVNLTGIRRVVIGGIEALGPNFLDRLRSHLSGEGYLMHGVSLCYADLPPESDARGVARYYIDHAFSITMRS